MKIIAISCSPRKRGNTMAMLRKATEAARAEGAEVELYSVAGKDLRPCDGCWACRNTGKCHIEDDMQELFKKITVSEGLIFGTPVYFWGMTAQAKAIVDRSLSLYYPERLLASKVCGVVATAGSLGLVDALKDFSYFIVQHSMLPANQVSAYFSSPEDLEKMPKCLEELDKLGRQMVALIKMGFRYPQDFYRGPGAYGTHTM